MLRKAMAAVTLGTLSAASSALARVGVFRLVLLKGAGRARPSETDAAADREGPFRCGRSGGGCLVRGERRRGDAAARRASGRASP